MSGGDRFSAPLIDLVDGLKKAAFKIMLVTAAITFAVTAIVTATLFALAIMGQSP